MKMKKYMVIIAIVEICLVFAVAVKEKNPSGGEYGEPVVGGYTPVDVKSPRVQALAKIVLAHLQKEEACSDFTLLDVTDAEHRSSVMIMYNLKLRFKNGNNETKKCKVNIGATDDEFEKIVSRHTNGHHKQMTLNKPKPAPYVKGCECANLTK